jgi:hypothetical protein
VDNSNLDKKITSNGCTMKEGSLIFKLEHLDRYAIVKEPCTLIVKQPKLAMDDLYTEDNSPSGS